MANELVPVIPPSIVITTATPGSSIVVDGINLQKVQAVVQRMVDAPQITDQATFDIVRKIVSDAAAVKNAVDTLREIAKAPFLNIGKAIDKAAKAAWAPLDVVIAEGKRQETEFLIERDRQIAAERQRIADAEAAARADTSRPTAPLLPALQATAPIQAIIAPTMTRKVLRILNEGIIPAEYRVLDFARIERDLRQGIAVPGAILEDEKRVTAR